MSILGARRTGRWPALAGARLAGVCLILTGAVAAVQTAGAQQPNPSAPPPVAMNNWRYDGNPSGMYTFVCGPPQCASSAQVIYQLFPPNPQLTFEQYQQGAGRVTDAMQQMNPPGARLELLGFEDGSKQVGDLSVRLFKTRRLLTTATGQRRYIIRAHVLGSHGTASITSNAADEKSADAYLMQFAAPLWLLANAKLERAPSTSGAGPSTAAEAPPVAIGPDWRYEKQPNGIYMFHCQSPRCVPSSRVSYRLYPPNDTWTLAKYRQEQDMVVKALQQRAPPGTQVENIEITGDEGTGPRRMFTSRRVISHPDGHQEFTTSSVLLGSRFSSSLISSSPDEKAVKANHAVFALAVMLFINVDPKAKQ